MTYPKPWETREAREKRVAREAQVSQQAKRSFNRALKTDTDRRLDKDAINAIARNFVVHGDIVRALIATGFIDEDTPQSIITKIARRVRCNATFEQAVQKMSMSFMEHEILTRDRVLHGLYTEAADRASGLTTGSSRVAAWGKLATLMGMEEKEEPKDAQVRGGVMLIPFTQSIEAWEQAAMGQQAKLKADVRN